MEPLREEELFYPASPMGQCFESNFLSLYLLIVFEFEVPIHDFQKLSMAKDTFGSLQRFTSILVSDDKGVKRWKKVDVKWEEHLIEPKFIDGMSLDSYDKQYSNYLSKILIEKLPPTKPLWQIHIINYPTSNAAGTLVLKFHHSIGDGYTLMGLLLSNVKRADNPSLPLSFPKSSKNISNSFLKKIPRLLSMPFNSFSEFGWSLLKTTFVEDDKTPIRSGLDEGIDYKPSKLSNVIFPINNIKEIKSNLGVTINDVISGIIFYGIRLYMQDIDDKSKSMNSTALVMASTRNIKDYKSVEDMPKIEEANWGNRIIYLHVSIPKLKETSISNPLEFVMNAHTAIKKKKNSFAGILTSKLLLIKNKFQGNEAMAKIMRKSLTNSSLLISNMIGPLEKVSLANHPIKSFFFTACGMPQSLLITMISYMGMLRVTILTEEGFIDEEKLVFYLNNAYEIILHEAAKVKIP